MTAEAISQAAETVPLARPQANALLTAPILPTLLRLSMPNMIAMVAVALVATAETAYVGQLGTTALAAMALVFPMVMLQQMMSAGAMGGGVSSAISRAMGAGDQRRAEALALHAAIIGALAAVVISGLFLAFGPSIYRLLGGEGAVLDQALTYSNTVFLGVAGIWLTNTFASIIRGTGNMRVPSLVLLGTAGTQIAMSGALGLGLGPFPRLGMLGIGLGQITAFAGGTLVLLWFLRSGQARVRLVFDPSLLRGEMFGDILKVGALACLSPLQSVLAILILTKIVSGFGMLALAGYGIGARLEFLLIPITFAIGVACVPMVGMAIGAGEVERARRVAWIGGALSAAILGVIGLSFAFAPWLWAGLFTSEPGVLETAASYFSWAGPAYALFGLGLCLYFAVQGAGKVLWPVLAGTARLLVIILGGIWLTSCAAPAWSVYAMIAAGMAVYGIATAAAIWFTRWGK
jgi:putative MATE family efflux protein